MKAYRLLPPHAVASDSDSGLHTVRRVFSIHIFEPGQSLQPVRRGKHAMLEGAAWLSETSAETLRHSPYAPALQPWLAGCGNEKVAGDMRTHSST